MQTDVAETTQAHPKEHGHPSAAEYIKIAVVLAIITGAEVAVYYQESLRSVIVPILLILSACKFSLVVMFYMHLKFDNRLFTAFFTGPLALAFAVLIALVTLFHRLLFGV